MASHLSHFQGNTCPVPEIILCSESPIIQLWVANSNLSCFFWTLYVILLVCAVKTTHLLFLIYLLCLTNDFIFLSHNPTEAQIIKDVYVLVTTATTKCFWKLWASWNTHSGSAAMLNAFPKTFCTVFLEKWRNISNITTALQQGKNTLLQEQMLGDHSVSLWQFKWPTERLYKQDGKCPVNISVINAHRVLHTVGAAKRDVPLLGMWGWAICWPPTTTWEAGTGTNRGAGNTRTACTTVWHSCWTISEWAERPQRNTAQLWIFWCNGEYDGYIP